MWLIELSVNYYYYDDKCNIIIQEKKMGSENIRGKSKTRLLIK